MVAMVFGVPMGVRRVARTTGPLARALGAGGVAGVGVEVARETGVAYFACGHHASERYGAQALGTHLGARFGIEHHFIDIDNPA